MHDWQSTILKAIDERREGDSIDPNQLAKAIDPEGWRRQLGQIKSTCIGMARLGQIEILRKGRPVSPDGLKGLYRFRKSLSSLTNTQEKTPEA
jgi:hypothetical protein